MSTTTVTDQVARLSALLAEARERTLELIASVSDADLVRQHDALMSPILWDLGHIAHFEELWLTQNIAGEIRFSEMPGMYNPFEHPRRVRGELQYPTREEATLLMAEIRVRVLEKLEQTEWSSHHPLLRDGYLVHMVAQHEYQHDETILQTLQLKLGAPYTPLRRLTPPPVSIDVPRGAMVRFDGGPVEIGTRDRAWAYDNERPLHERTIRPFLIDVAPVRNGEYLAFMEDGGYRRRELWTDTGWTWLQEAQVSSPKYWRSSGGVWWRRSMDRDGPVHPEHPVCHVSFHEADAYARWADKRLPTEIEWEVAAAWSPSGPWRQYPWGDAPPTSDLANVDQRTFDTTPIGAYPRNHSALGCYGMIGDVWEWTSSDFSGYPGYESFPYPEYSEVFFGSDYKVLRGGSWATRAGVIRNTFRNWDYPIRRQIFSGFRCASDD